ncbi:hypothetical protein SDC9_131523 [bioreactor metagenome]|uniref:Secretion system C-terminal sorting domain-containing protein n=1 Tax=bioreactor metagenome TaxID=1076179 RepID=A0A645D5E2_9ZZZZ
MKFDYNRTGAFFDLGLLPATDCVDSLILVYREDPAHDWEIFPFTKTGNVYAGILTTPYGRTGEYALAVGEPGQSGIGMSAKDKGMLIYPNPAADQVFIENIPMECEDISICDSNGKSVLTKKVPDGYASVLISVYNLPPGKYFLIASDNKNNRISETVLTVIK